MLKSAFIAIALAFTALHVQSFEISTDYQDIAPKFILSGGVGSGICVEIFSALEAQNSEIHFSESKYFTPLMRIMYGLQDGSVMAFCGAAHSENRAKKMIYSDIPLYSVSTLLVVSKSNNRVYSSIDDLKADPLLRFSSIANTSTYDLLTTLGLNISKHSFHTIVQGLGISLRDKNKVFAYHSLGLKYALSNNEKWQSLKLLTISLREYKHWMVFNKRIRKEHLDAINTGLKALKDKKIIEGILLKYQDY